MTIYYKLVPSHSFNGIKISTKTIDYKLKNYKQLTNDYLLMTIY